MTQPKLERDGELFVHLDYIQNQFKDKNLGLFWGDLDDRTALESEWWKSAMSSIQTRHPASSQRVALFTRWAIRKLCTKRSA